MTLMLAQSFNSFVTLAQSTTQTIDAGEAAAGAAAVGIGFMCCFGLFALVLFAFWLWMLIDCCTKTFPEENDKIMWVLIIVLVGPIGAAVYFFVGRPKGVKT